MSTHKESFMAQLIKVPGAEGMATIHPAEFHIPSDLDKNMSTQPTHEVNLIATSSAIEHLSLSYRGQRTLALLYALHQEVCLLDTGNLSAAEALVKDMTAGTHNGAINELLRRAVSA